MRKSFVKSALEAGNVFAVIEVPHLLRAELGKHGVRVLLRVFENAAHDGFVDNSGVIPIPDIKFLLPYKRDHLLFSPSSSRTRGSRRWGFPGTAG